MCSLAGSESALLSALFSLPTYSLRSSLISYSRGDAEAHLNALPGELQFLTAEKVEK